MRSILFVKQNNNIDISILQQKFYQYNIQLKIIDDYSDIDHLSDEFKYILVNNRDDRLYNYIISKNIQEVNNICHKYKFIFLPSSHSTDYTPSKRYINQMKNNKVLNVFLRSCYCGYIKSFENTILFDRFHNFFLNKIKMPLVKLNLQENVLDKDSFFKINNLDLNKKLVVIFTSKIHFLWKKNTIQISEQHIFKEKKILNYLVTFFKKNNCNVVFKSHPSRVKILNNKLIINKDKRTLDMFKKDNININEIESIYNNYFYIDNCYFNEIHKYTDYGILFSGITSVFKYLYLYNIPIFFVDFKLDKWSNSGLYQPYHLKNYGNMNIREFHYKYLYGIVHHLEDTQQLEQHLQHFIKLTNNNYKYLLNNPYYDNNYECTYENVVKSILKIIN